MSEKFSSGKKNGKKNKEKHILKQALTVGIFTSFFLNVINGRGNLDLNLEGVVIENVCFCNLYMNGKCIVRFVNISVMDMLQVVYSVKNLHGYFSVSMSLTKK